MENECPEVPALREVRQVISRLRESLSEMSQLAETRASTIKDLRGELVLRIEELSQARADLANARWCLVDAEAERPEPVADGSPLHARLQAEALRFPAGNPRRRYLMDMADDARCRERDADAARSARARLAAENSDLREELTQVRSALAIAQRLRLEATAQQDDLHKRIAHAEACNAGLRRDVQADLAALSRIAVKLDAPAQGQWQPIGERIDVLGGQIAALNLKLSLAEQENKLLAERLGIAYGREIDARRELADARILLDIALKQARQPAPAK